MISVLFIFSVLFTRVWIGRGSVGELWHHMFPCTNQTHCLSAPHSVCVSLLFLCMFSCFQHGLSSLHVIFRASFLTMSPVAFINNYDSVCCHQILKRVCLVQQLSRHKYFNSQWKLNPAFKNIITLWWFWPETVWEEQSSWQTSAS